MIERYHHALRITARLAHAGRKPALTLLLAFGLAGCRHKHLRQVLPQGVLAPVDLETVDDQDSLPEITPRLCQICLSPSASAKDQ